MKIALAGVFVGHGGVQTHFYWLTKALLAAGHEVRIYSLGRLPDEVDRLRLRELAQAGNLSLYHVYYDGGIYRFNSITAARRMVAELRTFQPDVYLACGTGWNLFLPAWGSQAAGKLVFHEVMSGEVGSWRDSRCAVGWGFDEVIAQARPVAENFGRTSGWKNAVRVLPAFPEPLEVTAKLPAFSHRSVPAGKARGALFSRLVPHKQAFWLVQQWWQLKDVLSELHIFGSGPEEPSIRDFILKHDLSSWVFCHGAYPAGQAYVDLLSGFDLTLLPTVGAEGAPLVLLESMACGVPFVAFDVGGIPDYANRDCIICPAKSSGSFITAIQQMTSRLAAGTVDSQRLQQFYLDHYSFTALSRLWCNWLTQAIKT